MVTVEVAESIARPPADVFAFVADMRNEPRWHTDVLDAQLTQGTDVGAGAKFAVKFKPQMGMSEGTATIADYDPPSRVAQRVTMGKMQATITFTVEPEGAGAKLRRRIELEPAGIARIMAPLMPRMIRKANQGFLGNLKRLLEDGATAGA